MGGREFFPFAFLPIVQGEKGIRLDELKALTGAQIGTLILIAIIMVGPKFLALFDRGQAARIKREEEARAADRAEVDRLTKEVASAQIRTDAESQTSKAHVNVLIEQVSILTRTVTEQSIAWSDERTESNRRFDLIEAGREKERIDRIGDANRAVAVIENHAAAMTGLTLGLADFKSVVLTKDEAQQGHNQAVGQIEGRMNAMEESISAKIAAVETKVDNLEKHLKDQDTEVRSELAALRREIKELRELLVKPDVPPEAIKPDVPDPAS